MTDVTKDELNTIADQLLPVSALLMQLACEQEVEHTEICTCRLCRAFVATQDCMTRIEQILKAG